MNQKSDEQPVPMPGLGPCRIKTAMLLLWGACPIVAFGVGWMLWQALIPTVTLDLIAYKQKPGNADYYAELRLTNRTTRRAYYTECQRLNPTPEKTIPVWYQEQTPAGWSAEKPDQSSFAAGATERRLARGQSITFLIPVEPGALPKRVGVICAAEPKDTGDRKFRAWFSKLKTTLGLRRVHPSLIWCREPLVAPDPLVAPPNH